MNEARDLLDRLKDPKITLFEEKAYIKQAEKLGREAIGPVLDSVVNDEFHTASRVLQAIITGLPETTEDRTAAALRLRGALGRGRPLGRRKAAIEGLSKCAGVGEAPGWLTDVAMDVDDDSSIRIKALWGLQTLPLPKDQAERLVALLHPAEPREFLNALLASLTFHAGMLPLKPAQVALDRFLISTDPEIRGRAIDLLGHIGEVDAIERVCMLPVAAAEIERVNKMVNSILQRPCNLLHLRSDYFETFIGQVARKMGYDVVDVCGGPGDGGVDINATRIQKGFGRLEREEWVIQCKRYAVNIRVPPLAVQDLIRVRRERKAAKALLITTSSFTKDARALADEHAPDIRLIEGSELLVHLDEFFGANRYTIKSRG